MINSRQKGKRGELSAARFFREYGYDVRRGQQYSGANGDADIEGLPGTHIEVKTTDRLNLEKALQQSEEDAYADSLKHGHKMRPIVYSKANYKDAIISCRAEVFMEFYIAWEAQYDPAKDEKIVSD